MIHFLRFIAIVLGTGVVALLLFMVAAYASKSKVFSPNTWSTNVILSLIITGSLLGIGIGLIDSRIFDPITGTVTIPSSGIMLLGDTDFEIYWDVTATNEVTMVEWGILEPGGNGTVQFWVKNEGNVDIYCEIGSDSWTPPGSDQYFDLTWNFGDTPISQYRSRKVTLELHVHDDVTEITDFTFDIIIYGATTPFT